MSNTDYQRLRRIGRKMLEARFPRAFFGSGESKKPLCLDIEGDLRRACLSADLPAIEAALTDYINGPRYLIALVKGAVRVDLRGEPAGVVSGQQATLAHNRLMKKKTFAILPPDIRATLKARMLESNLK
jgi:sRNA-binding protein